jgi:hypothetical protein
MTWDVIYDLAFTTLGSTIKLRNFESMSRKAIVEVTLICLYIVTSLIDVTYYSYRCGILHCSSDMGAMRRLDGWMSGCSTPTLFYMYPTLIF